MRFEGTLTTWNAERGIGEITPLLGGQAVVVHASALPMEGEEVGLGELLSFEIVSGRDGRKAAARVQRLQRMTASAAERLLMAAAPRRPPSPRQRRRRLLIAVGSAALLASCLGAVYQEYRVRLEGQKALAVPKRVERRASLEVVMAQSLTSIELARQRPGCCQC